MQLKLYVEEDAIQDKQFSDLDKVMFSPRQTKKEGKKFMLSCLQYQDIIQIYNNMNTLEVKTLGAVSSQNDKTLPLIRYILPNKTYKIK